MECTLILSSFSLIALNEIQMCANYLKKRVSWYAADLLRSQKAWKSQENHKNTTDSSLFFKSSQIWRKVSFFLFFEAQQVVVYRKIIWSAILILTDVCVTHRRWFYDQMWPKSNLLANIQLSTVCVVETRKHTDCRIMLCGGFCLAGKAKLVRADEEDGWSSIWDNPAKHVLEAAKLETKQSSKSPKSNWESWKDWKITIPRHSPSNLSQVELCWNCCNQR